MQSFDTKFILNEKNKQIYIIYQQFINKNSYIKKLKEHLK
jgi:hypothetical protein